MQQYALLLLMEDRLTEEDEKENRRFKQSLIAGGQFKLFRKLLHQEEDEWLDLSTVESADEAIARLNDTRVGEQRF